jgi:hypothetical protein
MVKQYIQSFQEGRSLNGMKTILVSALIQNGFSAKVRLEDRRFQLRTAENVTLWICLLFFWAAAGKPGRFFTWLGIVFLFFLAEQVIDAAICWLRFFRQYPGEWSYLYKKSLSRPIYRRINTWFIVCLFIFVRNFGIVSLDYSGVNAVPIGILSIILLMVEAENLYGCPGQSVLPIGLWLIQGARQVLSMTKTALDMVAPGVIISMITGALSQEIWQFLDASSWARLLSFLIGLILLAMFFSMFSLRGSLRTQIESAGVEHDPFEPAEVYKAVIHSTPRSFAKERSFHEFQAFPRSCSWKWREKTLVAASDHLFRELYARAKWHFWLAVFLLLPLLMLFMSASTFVLFRADSLRPWLYSGTAPVTSNLFRIVDPNTLFDRDTFWIPLLHDPRVKYAAVSAGLLITSFVLRYAQDAKKVLSNLQTKRESLAEWFTLLCAYECLAEYEYQLIGAFWIPVGKLVKGSMTVPIILVPGEADEALMKRVSVRMQTVWMYRYPCIFIMKAADFLKSVPDYFYFGGETKEITIDVVRENSRLASCWVWLEKKNGDSEIQEFHEVDAAYRWVQSRSGGIELKKSERDRLLTYGDTNEQ